MPDGLKNSYRQKSLADVGIFSYIRIMEELITEIETYAGRFGVKPETVIYNAVNQPSTRWAEWKAGAGCGLKTADRIRAYMASNPPKEEVAAE